VSPPTSDPADTTVSPPTEEVTVSPPGVTPSDPQEALQTQGVPQSECVTPKTNNDRPSFSEGSGVDLARARAHARAHAPARGAPHWCQQHEKETRVSDVTHGLVWFACGCFMHQREWEASAA
jgi:hypothetical protein